MTGVFNYDSNKSIREVIVKANVIRLGFVTNTGIQNHISKS